MQDYTKLLNEIVGEPAQISGRYSNVPQLGTVERGMGRLQGALQDVNLTRQRQMNLILRTLQMANIPPNEQLTILHMVAQQVRQGAINPQARQPQTPPNVA